MRTVPLGSSRIPVLGQGCMGIGGYFQEDRTRDEAGLRALQAGIDAGLTFLDTAEVYGAGHSEELVGQVAAGQRDRLFIASKVAPEHLGYDAVLRAAEGSLKRLGITTLDLYQVHWPNPAIPVRETLSALERLVAEGMVRHLGLSNFSAGAMAEAQGATGARLGSNQVEYSLFDRSVEADLLPFCQARGVTLIAYSPLDKGSLGSRDRRSARLATLAAGLGLTAAQLSLAWLLAHPGVVAIPKAASAEHALENAAAGDLELPAAVFQAVDQLFTSAIRYILPTHIQTDDRGLETFVPTAADLAEALRRGDPLKPVRVVPGPTAASFVLVEGKLRYWAWVQAFGSTCPIPSLVRGDEGA
jgi:aryl-alcohol dehydrogenase-like predicted oxidoreductase